MPNFAANLSMMFNEVDFLDRFAAAARAGFKGVEFLFPYAFEKGALAARLQEHGLTQALFNGPPGDWDAGNRGLACLPDRVSEFRDGIGLALDYARALDCPRVHLMAGLVPEGLALETLRETYVENLRYAATQAAETGITLLIEPINSRDMPGYFLNTIEQALEILDTVDADNLRLQFDIYHRQIMGGDLAPTIERVLPRIAHMQLADTPGRHEPGTGEINYPFLFDWIDRLGYDGWIGCEYVPAGRTEDGLAWARPYLAP